MFFFFSIFFVYVCSRLCAYKMMLIVSDAATLFSHLVHTCSPDSMLSHMYFTSFCTSKLPILSKSFSLNQWLLSGSYLQIKRPCSFPHELFHLTYRSHIKKSEQSRPIWSCFFPNLFLKRWGQHWKLWCDFQKKNPNFGRVFFLVAFFSSHFLCSRGHLDGQRHGGLLPEWSAAGRLLWRALGRKDNTFEDLKLANHIFFCFEHFCCCFVAGKTIFSEDFGSVFFLKTHCGLISDHFWTFGEVELRHRGCLRQVQFLWECLWGLQWCKVGHELKWRWDNGCCTNFWRWRRCLDYFRWVGFVVLWWFLLHFLGCDLAIF